MNLHLAKVRSPCSFSNKSLIISKPDWPLPHVPYLCCTAHHTSYTSEHRFLPLRTYQYCRSEHRSHGLSPHSCLEQNKDTEVIGIQEGHAGHAEAFQNQEEEEGVGFLWRSAKPGIDCEFSLRSFEGRWAYSTMTALQRGGRVREG